MKIAGHIDLVTPRQLFGWVWDKSDPSRRLDVFAHVSTAELAQGAARFFRSDLASAGIGDGSYAFYLHFARALSDEMLHSIEVGVRGDHFKFPILPSVTPIGSALFVPEHLKDFEATWYFAEKTKGWLSREEAELLYKLASSARSGRVVELGSYCGQSSIVLAAGLIAASTDPLVCVDHFGGSPEHQPGRRYFDAATLVGERVDTYPIFQHTFERAGLQGVAEVMRMSTIDAALHFLSRVQLLFVDADHSYEGVHADLEAWTPKLNEGGFIVLHDFGTWPGVTRAAADLLDEGYCHHSQSGSALVLQKTADAPEILK